VVRVDGMDRGVGSFHYVWGVGGCVAVGLIVVRRWVRVLRCSMGVYWGVLMGVWCCNCVYLCLWGGCLSLIGYAGVDGMRGCGCF